MSTNRNLVLLAGASATGKTASLRNLRNPEGVIYLNCEAGKELPFPSKFRVQVITHPAQVFEILTEAEKHEKIHTIVIDSLTYLMDQYESLCVVPAANTMKAWGDYAQYFKKLMQVYVASSTKNVIFTAHTANVYNEGELIMEVMVKVKGATMNNGVESYFNNVIACKKMPITKLEGSKSDMLTITPQEEAVGFKYVYQTQLTKETVNERIRGPMQLWGPEETFIDNDIQQVLDQLHAYFAIPPTGTE